MHRRFSSMSAALISLLSLVLAALAGGAEWADPGI